MELLGLLGDARCGQCGVWQLPQGGRLADGGAGVGPRRPQDGRTHPAASLPSGACLYRRGFANSCGWRVAPNHPLQQTAAGVSVLGTSSSLRRRSLLAWSFGEGGLRMDLQRWADAVIAFRFFELRAKKLSLAQCVGVVHREYTGRDPDPHAENQVYVLSSVVELVLERKGDAAEGVSDSVRQAWQELASTDAPRELVRMATRSVWRAQDERRLGGRYGDRPSEGCKGIGIHRDEI